jgi:hypothetical protein
MKTKLGLFLGALLVLSITACDGSSTGTGGTGGGGTGGGGTAGSPTGGTGGSPTGGTGGSPTGGAAGTMSAGPSCDKYCTTILANCKDANSQYGDDKACQGICAKLDLGMSADTSGDTLGCREYHAGMPAVMDPTTHCPHAGPLGAGQCGTADCDQFCKLAVAVCGDQPMDKKPYADEMACKTACAMFPGTDKVPYNAMATAGNSLACRMYHLSVASGDASAAGVHCIHVAEKSDPCQ